MSICLFCRAPGPFTTVEHVIPESLGNDEVVLKDQVCDGCQAYFGREVEKFVLEKTPLAAWRTLLSIPTKKGRLPSVDLSTPSRDKGTLPARHAAHDDGVGFTAHEDGSVSIDVANEDLAKELARGERSSFNLVLTPKVLHMLGRFLLKVGLELVATVDAALANASEYDDARSHARRGNGDRLWPIFHFTRGSIDELRTLETDNEGVLEHTVVYDYAVLKIAEFKLLRFSIGTDHWIVSLSHRYPDPRIREAFPGETLNLLWYADVA